MSCWHRAKLGDMAMSRQKRKQGRSLIAALIATAVLSAVGCLTTEERPGDHAARDIEKTLVRFDEACDADDYDEAAGIIRDIDRTVERDRNELELHPEASMLFAKIDNAKRRLRQLQKRIEEKRAQEEAVAVETRIREPLEEAAEVAQKTLDGWPTQADVAKLKGKVENAQDALNDGRRGGKIELEGEFVAEIEARLTALRSTLAIAERKAIAGDAGNAYKEGLHAIDLAAGRPTPSEKMGDYEAARNKLGICAETAEQLLADDPEASGLVLEVEGSAKPLSLKALVKLCKKETRSIKRLERAAGREQKSLDKLKKFAEGRSPDQRAALEEHGKKPDVMRKKKGKQIWTFVEKKEVKKGKRKKTKKIYHEYSFDREGKLLDKKSKKR